MGKDEAGWLTDWLPASTQKDIVWHKALLNMALICAIAGFAIHIWRCASIIILNMGNFSQTRSVNEQTRSIVRSHI